jgi:hypothetical protein
MTHRVAHVTQAAADARGVAREAATAARDTRTRSRLLRGQTAALRAKLDAGHGRTQTREVYLALLAEVFASSGLMDDLRESDPPADNDAVDAARSAHRRILGRLAALGPSLPN